MFYKKKEDGAAANADDLAAVIKKLKVSPELLELLKSIIK